MPRERLDRLQTHFASGGASAKRATSRRSPTETWFHYYAGFPASFAADAFLAAELDEADTVLDPWNGSGTTTEAARDIGVHAVGIDINPVANLVGSARLVWPSDARHVSGLVDELISSASEMAGRALLPGTDSLTVWLPPRSAAFARAFQQKVIDLLATSSTGQRIDPLREPLPPLAALLTLAMSRAIRAVAPPLSTSNPVWQRPDKAVRVRVADLVGAYRSHLAEMVTSLGNDDARAKRSNVTIFQGDARALPLRDREATFILTSPPYLTRVDYVVPTALELALLGKSSDEVKAFRKDMMGTPLARSSDREEPRSEWGPVVRNLLDQVAAHSSADSYSYYYKTFWQYFDDASRSLKEIRRVLTTNGVAVVIVQNSYYKDIEVDLPGLLGSLGAKCGLVVETRVDEPVKRALTSINTRAQRHRTTRAYAETALLMRVE